MKHVAITLLLLLFWVSEHYAQRPSYPSRNTKPKTVIPGTANAQPQGSGKITGVVVNEATGEIVEFATVALVNKATNKTVDGTTSDEKGKFTH